MPDVIVCGGGIVGCATAYFLSLQGYKPLVIDRLGVASCASGKAGGFLARNWGSTHTKQISQKGFDLHTELSSELKLASYRRLPTLQVGHTNSGKGKSLCPWLNPKTTVSHHMDDETAQVTPLEITTKLMEAAKENGATFQLGRVDGFNLNPSGSVTSVVVDNEPIEAEKVVVCMGPWTVHLEEWLGVHIPIHGYQSTSIVYKFEDEISLEPYALFSGDDQDGCHLEFYPRPDKSLYICGLGGSAELEPEDLKQLPPEEVKPNVQRVSVAHKAVDRMTTLIGQSTKHQAQGGPDAQQSCIRPCPPDAMPMIGKLPAHPNVYIGAGHNCWGILWGPITGKALANLILNQDKHKEARCDVMDLSPFNPLRFRA